MLWTRGTTLRVVNILFKHTTTERRCTSCEAYKPTTSFSKIAGTHRLASWCRFCTREANKARYHERAARKARVQMSVAKHLKG